MVGSAIVRRLSSESVTILTAERSELDVRHGPAVERWLAAKCPDVIVLAAAKVGGIFANSTFPVDFLYDNLAMELAVIKSAFEAGVKKLLFLGSSCIYPKHASQPMSEDALLTGPLEPTNEWYAVAKIAGLKLCQAYRRQYEANFISVMPTNIYGPGDNYHPEHSHAPAALIRRMDEAKRTGATTVRIWGTGKPLREFMYVDDLADACVFVLKHYKDELPLNVGVGEDLSIAEFAAEVAATVGYQGQFSFDTSRPDGPPRKLLDVTRLTAMGWRAQTPLREGLARAYADFQQRRNAGLL
jgi:GDP-L-fucose synthase